jgi:argininosuccinate synthase
VLWPAGGTATSGSEFVEFECGTLTVKVKNSVISPVTSNAMKLTATIKYTAAKGVQKPTKFEGGPNMFLESKFSAAPYEQSGQSATTIQTNEEKVEVRSL